MKIGLLSKKKGSEFRLWIAEIDGVQMQLAVHPKENAGSLKYVEAGGKFTRLYKSKAAIVKIQSSSFALNVKITKGAVHKH